ncbi:trypsin-like peptidase domain-containing protein [Candidatus Roizmanbacteria bacterium]|nr:trypsin-like peptidase domain-containing protein [Candidatus Roizmanbacteria bacterium]
MPKKKKREVLVKNDFPNSDDDLISRNFSKIVIMGVIITVVSLIIYIESFTSKKVQEETFQPPSPTIEDPQNCDEEETLNKTKACTVIIWRDDGGHGSGFSIHPGYVVTNRHVVEGAKKLSTWVNNEEGVTLWGYSETEDLAVLKLNTEISICNWTNSSNDKLAKAVYAFGWPYVGEGESSITKGIYSRSIKSEEGAEFIQTDAAINPGNSGGPLVDRCGVIGINFAKLAWSDPEIFPEGFSFAIASNYAKQIIDDLINNGKQTQLPIPIKELPEYTPIEPEQANPVVPTIDLDPIVNCNIHVNCAGGTIKMRQSECTNSVCCQIRDKWHLYSNRLKCAIDQFKSAPPIPLPTFSPLPTFTPYPTPTPFSQPTIDRQKLQQECRDRENKLYEDILNEYRRIWGHDPTTDLLYRQYLLNLANCDKP